MAREIIYIATDEENSESRIESVAGEGWEKSEATVIAEIEAGLEYFVAVDGRLIEVVVAMRDGRKYLRSDPDRSEENNLLWLPRCR